MGQQHFWRTLRHFWYVPLLMLVASVGGVHVYNTNFVDEEAQATVGVLDPVVARPSYGEAAIGFDAVVRSRKLAERVAARMDRTTDWVQSHVSVAIVPPLGGFNISPLYAVRGKGADANEAARLTDVTTDEARALFIELNTPDPQVIRDSFATLAAQHEAELRRAKTALSTFVAQHGAQDLPTRIAKERELVVSLTLSLYQALAEQGAVSATDVSAAARATATRVASVEGALETARVELDRLVGLEPRNNDLSYAVQIAQSRVTQIESLPLAMRPQVEQDLEQRRAELDKARQEWNSFMAANDARDLPARLAKIRNDVAILNASLSQAKIDREIVATNDTTSSARAANSRVRVLDGALADERGKLDELLGIQSDYDQLAFDVQLAQGRNAQLEQLVDGLINGQRLPLAAQLKLLDQAQPRSQFLWLLLLYAVGVLAGLFLGATAIYGIALGWREPVSAEKIASTFGAPVLVRVPSARS